MKIHFDLDDFSESYPNPVITLGNFDGVHLGHQEIFRVLRKEAQACDGTALVVTFYPHPMKILCPERAPRLIASLEERIERIGSCGNDVLVCLPFTREFSHWSAGRFVQEVLVEKLSARMILVGEDFRFGKNREGDLAYLKVAGKTHGFSVRKINPVKVYGREVSSTRIRYCVQKGMIREATALLGRPYGLAGIVEQGDRRGRELGFPTANLQTRAELLPPNGVYAVWITLGERLIPGVANLGTKPTFSGSRFTIEVHIFDFQEDIYGTTLHIHFVEWIREERTFPNIQALVEQIQIDARKARTILGESRMSGPEEGRLNRLAG